MSKYLVWSLMAITLIVGLGIGYMLTPEYVKQSSMRTNTFGAADEKYDQRFLEAMIEHHEEALEMAEDALEKSNREEVKQLAQEIISAQREEIEKMEGWINQWYGSTN
jgi:uncharacterized protein (DUF305 family)